MVAHPRKGHTKRRPPRRYVVKHSPVGWFVLDADLAVHTDPVATEAQAKRQAKELEENAR